MSPLHAPLVNDTFFITSDLRTLDLPSGEGVNRGLLLPDFIFLFSFPCSADHERDGIGYYRVKKYFLGLAINKLNVRNNNNKTCQSTTQRILRNSISKLSSKKTSRAAWKTIPETKQKIRRVIRLQVIIAVVHQACS